MKQFKLGLLILSSVLLSSCGVYLIAAPGAAITEMRTFEGSEEERGFFEDIYSHAIWRKGVNPLERFRGWAYEDVVDFFKNNGADCFEYFRNNRCTFYYRVFSKLSDGTFTDPTIGEIVVFISSVEPSQVCVYYGLVNWSERFCTPIKP